MLRPRPGRCRVGSRARLVGYLIQRLPLDVTSDGSPMSCAHPSGTTGSTTIFAPARHVLDEPLARDVARVLAREDLAEVHASRRAPCTHSATATSASSAGRSAGPRAPTQSTSSQRGVRGERAQTIGRIGISQRPKKRSCVPMNSRNSTGAGTRIQKSRGASRAQQDRARRRRSARHPAQAPGQRPQVVEDAVLLGEAELAAASPAAVDWWLSPSRNAGEVEQRVRVGDQERDERRRPRRWPARAARAAPPARRRAAAMIGSSTMPAVYFVAQAEAEPEAGDDVVARRAAAHDAADARRARGRRRPASARR